jgi:uncharacterized protein (DUF58 family)
MGVFILLIIILSCAAGAIRGELVLVLTGAAFGAAWVYCLAMTLLLALLHSRRAGRISIRISPRETAVGGRVQVLYSDAKEAARYGEIFQLPGILVRCRLLLKTRDGRRIQYDFKPANKAALYQARETFEVTRRGAYFSQYDEFAVFDMLGFFRFAFRVPCESGARLLASPQAADEPVPAHARAGESDRQPEAAFQRTDILIEHRPYVPGDDPRRINWKLYSHGGELFVREGEREPPPHSNIIILIDTQCDHLLYSARSGRRAVDILCENALAIALACTENGRNVQIGYTGPADSPGAAGPAAGTPAELAAALAWPAACPLSIRRAKPRQTAAPVDLPSAPEDRGILILALPRAIAEPSALDRFLSNHASRGGGHFNGPAVDIVFLYSATADEGGTIAYTERAAAAETCASLYNQRPGVRAEAVGL